MDSDSIFMLLAMILLVALSAFFSATETAYTSFNRIKLKSLAAADNRSAAKVLKLDEKYERLLTAILVGNNIVNISLTTISTMFFMKLFSEKLSDDAIAAVSTAVVTIVILIFGEISPKAIAKDHADGYVLSTHGIISFLITILFPITIAFSAWKKLLNIIFKSGKREATTEDELITMVDEAEHDGGLDEDESELIRSAIEFSDLTAGEVLTPRIDIVAVTDGTDMREIMMMFFETGFSRLPVIGDSIDDIKGVLHEKDFFYAYNTGKTDLTQFYQKPLYISKHHKVDDLLRDLQNEKCHMAFVIDEFGGLMGIVTMEDIIEELIGDVYDEHDEVETLMVSGEDGSLTVDCSASLDDMFDYFDLKYDDDDSDKPLTVNGWVQKHFEGIPDEGESFIYNDTLEVTVVKCDEKMVKEVVIKKIKKDDEEEDE